MKKGIICFLICMLMVIGTMVSISATTVSEKTSQPLTRGNILYVGGSGPNNYTKIQDAIDVSIDGDWIFVYDDSSPYYENVVVDKSVHLIGEKSNTTIIDGTNINPTVQLIVDGITLQEFTLRHCEELQEEFLDILFIYSNDNIISNNIFIGEPLRKETMLMLKNSSRNFIVHNHIERVSDKGIELRNSHDNVISGNVITGIIWRRGFGINLIDSSNNTIKRNEISSISCCVELNELSQKVVNNQIIENNFMNYYVRASGVYFEYDYDSFQGIRGNTFDGNYWNRPRIIPKYVLGWARLFGMPLGGYEYLFQIPLPKFDLHPAQKPYDLT